MKKIVLSLAGVLAAAAFAPEAAAVPAFARQTGMACSACHQQHFPVLNSFGRAFKAGGYTMMGAQGKVEGEHLSIPDTLNASMVLKVRYQKQTNGAVGTGNGLGTVLDSTGNGQMQFADEFALLFGGRVAENVGFLTEVNLAGTTNGAVAGGLKTPFLFDVGAAKFSVIPFTTDAHGPAYGYELGSTGVLRANRWSEMRRDTSANQYAMSDGNGSLGGFNNGATGFAFVAQNDMGYINYTRYTPNHLVGGGGTAVASYEMKSNYLRIAATPTVGNWALHVGAGFLSGTSEVGLVPLAAVPALGGMYETVGRFADLQAHGVVGGKELGVYASYANSPVRDGGTCGTGVATAGNFCNVYNPTGTAHQAWQIGADYSIIPHALALQASYRAGERGGTSDNALLIGAIYDYTQNVALHANVVSRSGGRYVANAAGVVNRGKSEYLMMLEMSW
jgi:hypothetical protein